MSNSKWTLTSRTFILTNVFWPQTAKETPKALSCFSRQLSPGMEITLSARVMGHYESQGVKYTRLGYVKYG